MSTATAKKDEPVQEENGVAAVNRALSLLAAFSRSESALTLAQLAERSGLYKSTILRLCESLEAFGYLQRSPDGRYRPGPAPLRLAAIYQSNLHPAEVVMPVLRALAQHTGESAALYVRAGDQRLCAYRATSPRAITDNVRQGDLLPLKQGAGGHVLLAFSGEPGKRYTLLRQRMVSITIGQRDKETAALACPVFGSDQRLEGALSLSGPIQRFTPDAIAAMGERLLTAARQLTTALGGDADAFDHATLSNDTAA